MEDVADYDDESSSVDPLPLPLDSTKAEAEADDVCKDAKIVVDCV